MRIHIFGLLERAIRETYLDQSKERLESVERLREEADRLNRRLEKLYVDHLDGRVPIDMHDRMAATWREERDRCQRQIDLLHSAEDIIVDDSVALLDIAWRMHRMFIFQPSDLKNSALNLLVSNCSWANGTLSVSFREPFAMLEKNGDCDSPKLDGKAADFALHPKWLPG